MMNLDTELYSPRSFRIAEEEERLLHFKREHIRYSSNVWGLGARTLISSIWLYLIKIK